MFKFKTHEQDKPETIKQKAQFKKLCQLCSPNFTKEDVLATEIDWPVVWKLALRHRVVPVMADRIKQLDIVVPDEIATMMADNVQQNLFKGMKQAAELVRLTQLFEENDIPFVVFKGIALLKLMGLELHQRHHGDIDVLLADVGDIERADTLLTNEMGYSEIRPKRLNSFNNTQKTHFFTYDKDVGYFNREKQISIELHFKLLPSDKMLPFSPKEIYSSRELVNLNAVKIPVMCVTHHQTYLLLHGSISRWFRLKWLSDVPLSSGNGNAYQDIESTDSFPIYERMILQSIYLANKYLGMPLPESILKRYRSNDSAIFLARVSTYFIENGETLGELRPTTFLNICKYYPPLLKYKLALMKSWRYKQDVLQQFSTDESDWKTIMLPNSLFFLYYFLHPFLWLKRQF